MLERRSTRALRVLWNLRLLGLFLIGPVVGVLLGGVIFGLPDDLRWAAVIAFLVSLSLFGMLAKGEWRRLSRSGRAR
ncbi:hypothetical protein [Lichenicoccus sp.]|uniref:hypothetical protein n=1 Tax=Lichenicoccus sp. TaxID=2781899 RepID=UPI003D1412AB